MFKFVKGLLALTGISTAFISCLQVESGLSAKSTAITSIICLCLYTILTYIRPINSFITAVDAVILCIVGMYIPWTCRFRCVRISIHACKDATSIKSAILNIYYKLENLKEL